MAAQIPLQKRKSSAPFDAPVPGRKYFLQPSNFFFQMHFELTISITCCNVHYCPTSYKIGDNKNLDSPRSRINTGFHALA
jgi:hypothetical protein